VLCNAIDALRDMRFQPANGDSEQTITPSIWIRTQLINNQQSGARAVIRIRDNGPGIDADLKQRIFDPFFTTKPPGKGTGLGLSISHQIIVEKHGGMFTCNSTPGQGTEFVIEIPI
jgi:signal transduction histidine kinase